MSDPNNEFEMKPTHDLNSSVDRSTKEGLIEEYYDGGKSKDIKEIRNETLWGYLRLNPGVSNFTIITYFATQFINGYEMGVLMGYPQYI